MFDNFYYETRFACFYTYKLFAVKFGLLSRTMIRAINIYHRAGVRNDCTFIRYSSLSILIECNLAFSIFKEQSDTLIKHGGPEKS